MEKLSNGEIRAILKSDGVSAIIEYRHEVLIDYGKGGDSDTVELTTKIVTIATEIAELNKERHKFERNEYWPYWKIRWDLVPV